MLSPIRSRFCGYVAGALVAGILSFTAPIAVQAQEQSASSAAAAVEPDTQPRGFISQPTAPVNVGNPVPQGGPEQRVALVIGNSNYRNVVQLPNPANDARSVSQLLNSAGFEVIQATDLGHDEMIDVLRSFSAKIAEKGPNTVAFVWYGGHGVQVAGDNYLIPVDARVSSEADLPTDGIRLVDVMATLQAVPSRMRIVMVDACRNNPFAGLNEATRGLAIVDAPNGSIVGYSTAPGSEALDGQGNDSPYTTAVLKLAHQPNVPIEQFFKSVRLEVNQETSGEQTPWESSSLTSNFYFFGDTVQAAAQQPVREVYSSASMQSRSPREAYRYALANDSVQGYQDFVAFYPTDPYADYIRALLAAKLMALAWHQAVVANSPYAYQAFYNQYPVSPYAQVALKLQAQPKLMPLYQPTNNFAPVQYSSPYKFTMLNQINPSQNHGLQFQQGSQGLQLIKPLNNSAGNSGLQLTNPVNNSLTPVNPSQGNHTLLNDKIAPGVDLAKGANGVKLNPVLNDTHVTTLPNNTNPNNNGLKLEGAVNGNHLATLPSNNNGLKLDPAANGSHMPPLANGNAVNHDSKLQLQEHNIVEQQSTSGQFKQGGGQLLNNGGNNAMQFHAVNNGSAHPAFLTNGNSAAFQTQRPVMQGPVLQGGRNFGGGGGGGMMKAFHM
jgi:hypothetical protein